MDTTRQRPVNKIIHLALQDTDMPTYLCMCVCVRVHVCVCACVQTREWYDKRLAAYKTRSAAALEELSKLTPLMNKLIVELVYRQW